MYVHFFLSLLSHQVGLRGAVDEQANFQTFWGSMVLLLRFSTGENWNGFMYDMVAEREDCEPQPMYDPDMCGFTSHANCIPLNGCGSWSIFPYMIRYAIEEVLAYQEFRTHGVICVYTVAIKHTVLEYLLF